MKLQQKPPLEPKPKRSFLGAVLKFLLHDLWDFIGSVGPMMIGMVLGALVGGGGAIFLGLSIGAGLLTGAVAGFLIAIFIQAMIIGGGF